MIEKKDRSNTKRNFIFQMSYEILILLLPFITSPYIARVVGSEGLGTYSYSSSVAYYFVLFSLLGIKNYGNRTIAKVRENQEKLNKTFSNLVALHTLISLISILAYFVYLTISNKNHLYAQIQILYVLSGLFDISWLYFGMEKFKLTVTRNTIIKIVNVICVFVFVKNSDDLWKYCLIMAAGALISQIILWIPLLKYVQFVRPTIKEMFVHFKPLCILFVPAISISLYKYMDKIMVGNMSGEVELGWYENAEKVINLPMTVISSFGTVMLPKMSNLASGTDKRKFQKYISLSMRYIMCLAFALTFGLAAVGRVFSPIFWGNEFVYSGNLIICLSVTMPFIAFANIIRTQYLIPNERDKDYLVSIIAGAVFNVVLNSFLIPTLGAMGASISTIGAEIMVCMIQALAVRRELPIIDYVRSFSIFALIGMFMFVGVWLMGELLACRLSTLIIQIASGAVFYTSFTVLYFWKTKDDIFLKMINKILIKRRGVNRNQGVRVG